MIARKDGLRRISCEHAAHTLSLSSCNQYFASFLLPNATVVEWREADPAYRSSFVVYCQSHFDVVSVTAALHICSSIWLVPPGYGSSETSFHPSYHRHLLQGIKATSTLSLPYHNCHHKYHRRECIGLLESLQ
jgi:hypothetical protein